MALQHEWTTSVVWNRMLLLNRLVTDAGSTGTDIKPYLEALQDEDLTQDYTIGDLVVLRRAEDLLHILKEQLLIARDLLPNIWDDYMSEFWGTELSFRKVDSYMPYAQRLSTSALETDWVVWNPAQCWSNVSASRRRCLRYVDPAKPYTGGCNRHYSNNTLEHVAESVYGVNGRHPGSSDSIPMIRDVKSTLQWLGSSQYIHLPDHLLAGQVRTLYPGRQLAKDVVNTYCSLLSVSAARTCLVVGSSHYDDYCASANVSNKEIQRRPSYKSLVGQLKWAGQFTQEIAVFMSRLQLPASFVTAMIYSPTITSIVLPVMIHPYWTLVHVMLADTDTKVVNIVIYGMGTDGHPGLEDFINDLHDWMLSVFPGTTVDLENQVDVRETGTGSGIEVLIIVEDILGGAVHKTKTKARQHVLMELLNMCGNAVIA